MACLGVSNTILYPGMICVGESSSLAYPPHPLNRSLTYETNLVAFRLFQYVQNYICAVRYIHLGSPERTYFQYKTEIDFCAVRYIHLDSPERTLLSI